MQIQRLLLALAVAALVVEPAAAQTQKIGILDLRKVFDNYWKTKQADANLKEEAAGLDKERQALVDQYKKTQENYQKLLDSAKDVAVAAEERDKRKKAAEDELLKLRELENNIKQFDAQARTTLGEKQRRMRDNLLAEIRDVIKVKAKAGNYSHVFDTVAESANNTPILLYTSGENDLTDEVLYHLNATAPPGALKPTETKPPANDKK